MQSTSRYLIGGGWLTSTNVYSGSGVLYYDSLTDLFSEEEVYSTPPQDNCSKSCFQSRSDSNSPVCVLQTHKLEGMQMQSPISRADACCFCFWFLLLGAMKGKEFRPYRV